MFSKYNAALRGVQPPKAELQEALFAGADTDPRLAAQFELLCAGNRYVNTLHCVTAAIGKLLVALGDRQDGQPGLGHVGVGEAGRHRH